MANWAQGHLALGPGPISLFDSTRSTAYLCLCILPMRRSLFNGQLGPGAQGPYPCSALHALLTISVYVSSQCHMHNCLCGCEKAPCNMHICFYGFEEALCRINF